jgi:fructokinase
VVLDPSAPDKPLARLRVPTEAEKGYAHIRAQILKVCAMLAQETGLPIPKRIGMGTPGIVDSKSGRLKNSNSQCLNGERLREDLLADSGFDFVLANDANCLALAEATLGAARGYETVFGIIMGTGVGGGIIVHGQVLPGCHGIAGEWGQIVLEPDGATSKYGTQGTIESIISGPGLEEYYAQVAGGKLPLKEIAARAAAKSDPHAVATIERLTSSFAKALSLVIDILDPHAIVLGGGVGNIDALYTEATRQKIAACIFNPTFDAALLKPILGDSAGVFGAAMLVSD